MELTHSIQNRIYEVRGERIILDMDLAELYSVETLSLNQAVKRNLSRFPADFMFQLTKDEWTIVAVKRVNLKSQSVISSHHGGRRTLPYVFTEQGAAMLSSVLHSNRAIQTNIAIMRAFVEIRRMLYDQSEIKTQLKQLKEMVGSHDAQPGEIYQALENLLGEKAEQRNWDDGERIGFKK
ncbi:MAG TPA: ORF6N domain-containing protein [Chitinophagaceae bacterium]|nr:ORF6N domain-containing protein [Chitinophagaceae bacterium]